MTKTKTKQDNVFTRELHSRIKNVTMRIDTDQAKLAKEFDYYFAWCAEDLWKAHFERRTYQYWLRQLESSEDSPEVFFRSELEQLQNFCSMPYNVRENSTGSLHREVSTWKFQCTLEFITILKVWSNRENKF